MNVADDLGRPKQPVFEARDVPARGVVYAMIGLFAGIGLAAVFVAGLFALMAHWRLPERATATETMREEPPLPHLEISPEAGRIAIEAAARRKLGGYGWTDRAAGRVRIPIDAAMRKLAEQGWPDPPPGGASP
ncbi:MAG: hypothetical protein AB7S92_01750 [Parvibaculaceae bacterium]